MERKLWRNIHYALPILEALTDYEDDKPVPSSHTDKYNLYLNNYYKYKLQETRNFILRRFVYRNISSIELVSDYK